MKNSNLKQVILITGGSNGIGMAIAKIFSQSGNQVVVIDKKMNAGFQSSDNHIHFIKMDILQTSELNSIMKFIEEKYGNVNILINCAGIYPIEPALSITEQRWDSVMELNLKAPFFLSQQIAKLMIKNQVEGSIINIASTAGKIARQGASHYCSSKAALVMLTKVLALEWAEYGIRVNAICPGVVETDSLLKTLKDPGKQFEHKEKLNKIPLKRMAETTEIAKSVLFLANSDTSGFITGQALYIDGGYSAGQFFTTFENPKKI